MRVLAIAAAAGGAAVAALVVEGLWWRSRAARPEPVCAGEVGPPAVAERAAGRALTPGPAGTQALAALAAAHASRPTVGTPKLQLPLLDELQALAVDDRRAGALATALTLTVGKRLHARPPCPPGDLRDRTELTVRFQVHADSDRSASAVLTGEPQIASGAPLSHPVLACLVSRLRKTLPLQPEPGGHPFLSGFQGTGTVRVRLP
jgi:hypothetical protein